MSSAPTSDQPPPPPTPLTNKPTLSFKVAMLGATNAGKTSLVLRRAKDRFLESTQATVFAACTRFVRETDERVFKYEIWDTAGQDRFAAIAPMYYRNAQCVIVVYDVTDEQSFARARDLITEVQGNEHEGQVIVLCGNKIDLLEQGELEKQKFEAQKFAEGKKVRSANTSARTGAGVDELFISICQEVKADELGEKDAVFIEKVRGTKKREGDNGEGEGLVKVIEGEEDCCTGMIKTVKRKINACI